MRQRDGRERDFCFNGDTCRLEHAKEGHVGLLRGCHWWIQLSMLDNRARRPGGAPHEVAPSPSHPSVKTIGMSPATRRETLPRWSLGTISWDGGGWVLATLQCVRYTLTIDFLE